MSVSIWLDFLNWDDYSYRIILNKYSFEWRKLNSRFCEIIGNLEDITFFNNILDELKSHAVHHLSIFSQKDKPILQFLGSRIFVEYSKTDLKLVTPLMIKNPTKTDYVNFQYELINMGLDKMAIYDPTYANDFMKLHSFLKNGKIQ